MSIDIMCQTKNSGHSIKGMIFNVQKFSIHDGPGIRDVVFLKGCPLRCRWCSNPESQLLSPELGYNAARCLGTEACGSCITYCPVNAIEPIGENSIQINRKCCTLCGLCAINCPAQALHIFGESTDVQSVLSIVEEDLQFYTRSGGGVTLSGGEPLVQAGFSINLLKVLKERGIDTAIETTGYASWEHIKKCAELSNTILYDIKCLSGDLHKKFTNKSNKLIIKNLQKLGSWFNDLNIIVRTPIIPSVNDAPEEVLLMAEFLKDIKGVKQWELMKYHRFGESKYNHLGKVYQIENIQPPSDASMNELQEVASKKLKIKVYVN